MAEISPKIFLGKDPLLLCLAAPISLYSLEFTLEPDFPGQSQCILNHGTEGLALGASGVLGLTPVQEEARWSFSLRPWTFSNYPLVGIIPTLG